MEHEEGNKLIADFMGHLPTVEYYVGKGQSSCYNPSQVGEYYPTAASQKAECERWLKAQKQDYPNGWVTKEGYEVKKMEWYKLYHSDWRELMPVVEKIEDSGGDFLPYWVNICGVGCRIHNQIDYPSDQQELISEYNSTHDQKTTKINSVWRCVVAFTQWHAVNKPTPQPV